MKPYKEIKVIYGKLIEFAFRVMAFEWIMGFIHVLWSIESFSSPVTSNWINKWRYKPQGPLF